MASPCSGGDAQYLAAMQVHRRVGLARRNRKRILRAESHRLRYERVEAGGGEAGTQTLGGAGAHGRERVAGREASQRLEHLRIRGQGDGQMSGDPLALLAHPLLEFVGGQRVAAREVAGRGDHRCGTAPDQRLIERHFALHRQVESRVPEVLPDGPLAQLLELSGAVTPKLARKRLVTSVEASNAGRSDPNRLSSASHSKVVIGAGSKVRTKVSPFIATPTPTRRCASRHAAWAPRRVHRYQRSWRPGARQNREPPATRRTSHAPAADQDCCLPYWPT